MSSSFTNMEEKQSLFNIIDEKFIHEKYPKSSLNKYPELQLILSKIYNEKLDFHLHENNFKSLFETIPSPKELYSILGDFSQDYCRKQQKKLESQISNVFAEHNAEITLSLLQQDFRKFRELMIRQIDIVDEIYSAFELFEQINLNIEKLFTAYCVSKMQTSKYQYDIIELSRKIFVANVLNQSQIQKFLTIVKDILLNEPKCQEGFQKTKNQINNINQIINQFSANSTFDFLEEISITDNAIVIKKTRDLAKTLFSSPNHKIFNKKEIEIISQHMLKKEIHKVLNEASLTTSDTSTKKQKKHKRQKKLSQVNCEKAQDVPICEEIHDSSKAKDSKQCYDEVKEFEKRLIDQANSSNNQTNKPILKYTEEWIRKLQSLHLKLVAKYKNI